MVSCLALLHSTHALVAQEGELQHTACGLSIAARNVELGLFAPDSAGVTCERCQQVLAAPPRADSFNQTNFNPKRLVMKLIEQVLNTNDAAGLADTAGGKLATELAPSRLNRMHELFPTWRATIDEMIAEGENIVVRYQAAYIDAAGLLGPVGPSIRRNQVVIFRLADRRLIGVNPIIDDFGIWGHDDPERRPARYLDPGSAVERHRPQ